MLVYLGANTNEKLVDQILDIYPNVHFLNSYIFPEAPLFLKGKERLQDSFLNFDSEIGSSGGRLELVTSTDYNIVPIIEDVMDDKNLSLLWTRFGRKLRFANRDEVKRNEVIYSLVKCAIGTCLNLKPKSVLFSYEPHSLPMYIFKQVAVRLGIPSYTMTISPFVWRLFCEKDGLNSTLVHNMAEGVNLPHDSVSRMIQEKQGGYGDAKPFYEKRDMEAGWGRAFKRLKASGWNPLRAYRCYSAAETYRKLSTSRDQFKGKKYVSFFLQYQPEQTTLPDGGLYSNQLFALQMLYSVLSPLGIALVVREHPATFEAFFDPIWRSAVFYETIINIGPDVYIDDISMDPFSLVEGSLAVSSVTGTVLLEAMLRGKPAIAFGKTTLKEYEFSAFIYGMSNEEDLRERFLTACDLSAEEIRADIERYLQGVYPSTYGSEDYLGNDSMSLEKLREVRFSALLQAFVDVLRQENISADG